MTIIMITFTAGLIIGWLFRDTFSSTLEPKRTRIATGASNPVDAAAATKKIQQAPQNIVEPVTQPEPEVPAPPPAETSNPAPDSRDDLKEIKGIGPVLEGKLNAIGVTRFRQLAELDGEGIKKLAENLGGSFPDRIKRDNWVTQARKQHLKKYGEKI